MVEFVLYILLFVFLRLASLSCCSLKFYLVEMESLSGLVAGVVDEIVGLRITVEIQTLLVQALVDFALLACHHSKRQVFHGFIVIDRRLAIKSEGVCTLVVVLGVHMAGKSSQAALNELRFIRRFSRHGWLCNPCDLPVISKLCSLLRLIHLLRWKLLLAGRNDTGGELWFIMDKFLLILIS